jgi:hypothetical protein
VGDIITRNGNIKRQEIPHHPAQVMLEPARIKYKQKVTE